MTKLTQYLKKLSIITIAFLSPFISATANAYTFNNYFNIVASGDSKIVMYNSLTGGAPFTGASTLTGASNFDFVGPLTDALNSGRFLGVEDGEINFLDSFGNIEQYNLLTGAGVLETPTGMVQNISLNAVSPHAGENLFGNSSIIDIVDSDILMLDTDGSASQYDLATRSLLFDYAWSTFTGGVLDGKALTQAVTDGDIVSTENGFIFVSDPTSGNTQLYSVTTGVYASQWGLTTAFVNGPLNGKTLDQSVKNTHGVADITFVGTTETDYVFYDSANKALVYYNFVNYVNSWVGATTTLPNTTLTGGEFAGSLDAAINSGRFLGVGDCALNFIASNHHLQQYNCLTGALIWDSIAEKLEGPQAGGQQLNDAAFETMDDSLVYYDEDGSLSVYTIIGGQLTQDPTWTTFTGGSLDGQPLLGTAFAIEDSIIYTIDSSFTVQGYYLSTGQLIPDVITWTNFSGGEQLDGMSLIDGIYSINSGTRFLGIAAGQMVFVEYTPLPPVVTVESITTTDTTPLVTGTTNQSGNIIITDSNTGQQICNLFVEAGQFTCTPDTALSVGEHHYTVEFYSLGSDGIPVTSHLVITIKEVLVIPSRPQVIPGAPNTGIIK